jgi:hypothetical protein
MKKSKVCRDFNSRTCIEVSRIDGVVSYIPLDIENGFHVLESSESSFDLVFKPIDGYAVKKACELYFKWAISLGASKEALDFFKSNISLSNEDYQMALAKATKKAAEKKPAAKKSTTTTKKAVEVKKAPAKKPVATVAKKAPTKTGDKKPSAASRFMELIMAGKLSDDGIFATVQKEFDLDDSKRSYVGWYRAKLKKDGRNPPSPL